MRLTEFGPSDVVAVLALVLSAILGVGGFRSNAAAREHERDLAIDARTQGRLQDTYVEALDLAERAGQWAQMIRPFIGSGPDPFPLLPDLATQARVTAKVEMFASDAVRLAYTGWRTAVQEITKADHLLTLEAQAADHRDPPPIDGANIHKSLYDDLKPREAQLRRELAAAMRSDLSGTVASR